MLGPSLTAPLLHCRAQVAEERRLGLTPALHMDATDERVQCQLEINFIDCVVTPLWEHCAHCFPALQSCMERVRANRAAYTALANCSNEEVAQVGTYLSPPELAVRVHALSATQRTRLAVHVPGRPITVARLMVGTAITVSVDFVKSSFLLPPLILLLLLLLSLLSLVQFFCSCQLYGLACELQPPDSLC